MSGPQRGHRPVYIDAGIWRCACGVVLGKSQREARDVMRFHRADLWMATHPAPLAAVAGHPAPHTEATA